MTSAGWSAVRLECESKRRHLSLLKKGYDDFPVSPSVIKDVE